MEPRSHDPATRLRYRPAPAGRRARGRGRAFGTTRTAYLYLALPVAFYLAFMIVPWVYTLWLSLYNWDGIGPATWAGAGNYVQIVQNPLLRSAIEHAFELLLYFCVAPVILGLLLTGLMTGPRSRKWTVTRTMLFMPQILPPVAVAVAWRFIYAQNGFANQVLQWIGLGSLSRAWLGDFTWAFPAVGLVGTWVGTGLCVVFFVAGAQKVPGELYEAIQVDGGGRIRQFLNVTLPHLRAEIGVAVTVTAISALGSFDIVYVMTGGGPGTTTMVPGVLVYQLGFTAGQVGQASALAMVLSAIVLVVISLINFAVRERS